MSRNASKVGRKEAHGREGHIQMGTMMGFDLEALRSVGLLGDNALQENSRGIRL